MGDATRLPPSAQLDPELRGALMSVNRTLFDGDISQLWAAIESYAQRVAQQQNAELVSENKGLRHHIERRANGMDPLTQELRAERDRLRLALEGLVASPGIPPFSSHTRAAHYEALRAATDVLGGSR